MTIKEFNILWCKFRDKANDKSVINRTRKFNIFTIKVDYLHCTKLTLIEDGEYSDSEPIGICANIKTDEEEKVSYIPISEIIGIEMEIECKREKKKEIKKEDPGFTGLPIITW